MNIQFPLYVHILILIIFYSGWIYNNIQITDQYNELPTLTTRGSSYLSAQKAAALSQQGISVWTPAMFNLDGCEFPKTDNFFVKGQPTDYDKYIWENYLLCKGSVPGLFSPITDRDTHIGILTSTLSYLSDNLLMKRVV